MSYLDKKSRISGIYSLISNLEPLYAFETENNHQSHLISFMYKIFQYVNKKIMIKNLVILYHYMDEKGDYSPLVIDIIVICQEL